MKTRQKQNQAKNKRATKVKKSIKKVRELKSPVLNKKEKNRQNKNLLKKVAEQTKKIRQDRINRINRQGKPVLIFKEKGRRIYTTLQFNKKFQNESVFYKYLEENGKQDGDLSYTDLGKIVENFKDKNKKKNIGDAINKAIEIFDPKKDKIELDKSFNIDVQLIILHILKYQSFNTGISKDYTKLEMEKTKIFLKDEFMSEEIFPADRENNIRYAFPALLDINRVSNGIITAEIYKAVYLLMKKLLDGSTQKAGIGMVDINENLERSIWKQRVNFNESFIDVLNENDFKDNDAKGYLRNAMGIELKLPEEEIEKDDDYYDQYSSDGGFDDSSYEFDENEFLSDEDNIAKAYTKRKVTLNTFGAYVKMTAQKKLIDKRNYDTNSWSEKYGRLERGIRRRREAFRENELLDKFDLALAEKNYYEKNHTEIQDRIENATKDERDIIEEFQNDFEEFYDQTSIHDIYRLKKSRPKKWKDNQGISLSSLNRKLKEIKQARKNKLEQARKKRKQSKKGDS